MMVGSVFELKSKKKLQFSYFLEILGFKSTLESSYVYRVIFPDRTLKTPLTQHKVQKIVFEAFWLLELIIATLIPTRRTCTYRQAVTVTLRHILSS